MSKLKDYSQFMDVLKADYVRLERPSFASSYRRAKFIAESKGWDIPSLEVARRLKRDMQELLNLTASLNKIPVLSKPMLIGVDHGDDEQSSTGFFNIEAAKSSCTKNEAISNWEELPSGHIVITAPRFLYDLANREEISFAEFIHGVIGQRRDEAMRSDLRLRSSERQSKPVDPILNKFCFFLLPPSICKLHLKHRAIQRFLSNVRRLTGGRKNV